MAPPCLRRLRPGAGHGDRKVNVVLIPGIGTPDVEEWTVVEEEKSNTTLEFWSFEHPLLLSSAFTWPKLLELGLPLVEQLEAMLSSDKNNRPTLVFLCHSLGGITLKQALCIANSQPQYRVVLQSTSAVGFFGTPHGVQQEVQDETLLSERTQLIVRSLSPNISRKCLTGLGDECWQVKDILLLFEDLDLRIDFLSVYENIETRVKKGQWIGRSRRVMLVDKQLAKIQARTETCIGLDSEHSSLCLLSAASGRCTNEVREWLKRAFENALTLSASPLIPVSVSEEPVFEVTTGMASKLHLSSDSGSNLDTSKAPLAGSSVAQLVQSYDLLPIINKFQTTMKPAQLPCFMVENRLYNREFFGRKDILDKMDQVLLPTSGSRSQTTPAGFAKPTHLTLCGQGGLGKSELAINFVFARRDNFDAVFWIRADDPGKLEEGNIAAHLGLEEEGQGSNPIASRELAKGWLANPKKLVRSGNDIVGQAEASWLIVFDNADDSSILEEYWPIFGRGSILLTSRDPSAKNRLDATGTSIDVQPLDEYEGAALFRKLSNRQTENEVVSREISRELGGLPLALAQMAGIVRYQQLSFSEFLTRYRDWSERGELYAYSVGGRINLRRGTISSVFAIDHLDRAAQVLLELCSVMDPDCIQELLFMDYASKGGRLEEFPKSNFSYASARTELLRCSLIQRNEKSKEFSLHRLVQDAVKATLTPERRRIILQSATDLLARAWGTTEIHRRHIKEVWENREQLYPHVLNLKILFEVWRGDIGWPDIEFAALLNEAGWMKHERGNQPICKSFCEASRAIIEHELPDIQHTGDVEDRRYNLLCDILYALGALANESNDGVSCMTHNEQFLRMRQRAAEIRGAADVRLALSYNQYAVACMMAGEVDKAIESFLTSISTYRSLKGLYEKGMDSNPILNVGFAYWLKGDLNSALEILTAGLKDRESVYGFMDTISYHTGRFYHALGNVKLDEGLPVQSEKHHKNALVQYQASIGEYHHKTADVCHRVAQHCMWREDYDNAGALINQALKAWNMQPMSYGPEIARTTFLRSKLMEMQGSIAEAAALVKEAAALRARISHAPQKEIEELEEQDFDDLVTFWSR